MDTDWTRTEVELLRGLLQLALDESYHLYLCGKARRSDAVCSCGWDKVRERIETALQETL